MANHPTVFFKDIWQFKDNKEKNSVESYEHLYPEGMWHLKSKEVALIWYSYLFFVYWSVSITHIFIPLNILFPNVILCSVITTPFYWGWCPLFSDIIILVKNRIILIVVSLGRWGKERPTFVMWMFVNVEL